MIGAADPRDSAGAIMPGFGWRIDHTDFAVDDALAPSPVVGRG